MGAVIHVERVTTRRVWCRYSGGQRLAGVLHRAGHERGVRIMHIRHRQLGGQRQHIRDGKDRRHASAPQAPARSHDVNPVSVTFPDHTLALAA